MKKNKVDKMELNPKGVLIAINAISSMALWSETPQGHTYWQKVKENLYLLLALTDHKSRKK